MLVVFIACTILKEAPLLGMNNRMAMSREINPLAAIFAGNLALSCCKVDPLNAEHQLREETGNALPASQPTKSNASEDSTESRL